MKEETAKTKWCPMMRLHVQKQRSEPYNMFLKDDGSGATIPPACFCVASECMMWVWNAGERDETQMQPQSGHCGLVR